MKCPRCKGTGEVKSIGKDFVLHGYLRNEYEQDGRFDRDLGTYGWFVNKMATRGDIQPQQETIDRGQGFSTPQKAKEDMCSKYNDYDEFTCKD